MKNLKYFILSQQSLTLYREFLKTIRRIPDASTKSEILTQLKGEYQKYRNVNDLNQMEYLIVTGRKQLQQLQSFIPR